MARKNSTLKLDVALKFIHYGTTEDKEKSGAYLFLPDGEARVCNWSVLLKIEYFRKTLCIYPSTRYKEWLNCQKNCQSVHPTNFFKERSLGFSTLAVESINQSIINAEQWANLTSNDLFLSIYLFTSIIGIFYSDSTLNLYYSVQDVLNNGILTDQTNNGPPVHAKPVIRVVRGPVSSELQLVTPLFIHTVRIIHSPGWDGEAPQIINEVDITRTNNYELAMHLTTGLQTGGNFVTDLNGFQLIRRKTLAKLPLQANYYPMPSTAFVEDDEARLTLVGQQPLGVASLRQGTYRFAICRRWLKHHDKIASTGLPFLSAVKWGD